MIDIFTSKKYIKLIATTLHFKNHPGKKTIDKVRHGERRGGGGRLSMMIRPDNFGGKK